MNGVGLIKYVDGSFYNGNFFSGKKNGYGKFQFNDGECYTGLWFQNERDGKGRYSWNNGDVFEGEFKKNRPYTGKLFYSNGKIDKVERS